MNICIVSTFSCTFDDFSALVKESEESFSEYIPYSCKINKFMLSKLDR